jgi:hypothetical protein
MSTDFCGSISLQPDLLCAITVLDTGGGQDHSQDQPEGVHEDVALPPVDLLGRVIAPDPPVSVVFTDWLSRMPALG